MIQKLADDMLLYHGSYCEVRNPDLKCCARYKDFGQGFYLTTSKKRAESFARISTRKAIARKTVDADQRYGIVSVFQICFVKELLIKTYITADAEWLHCVVGHNLWKVSRYGYRECRIRRAKEKCNRLDGDDGCGRTG